MIVPVNSLPQFNLLARRPGHRTLALFTGPQCGPCKVMKGFFKNLSEDRPELQFITTDAAEVTDAASGDHAFNAYGVRSVPTILAFEDGGPVLGRLVGPVNPRELRSWVESIYGEPA